MKLGQVPVDGGWRVYSSGPGIAIALLMRHLVGLRPQHDALHLDPVLPQALSGLVVEVPLAGTLVQLELHSGPLGHGPLRVTLDGEPLPFSRGVNPYRGGAAVVAWPAIHQRLAMPRPGMARLVVVTG